MLFGQKDVYIHAVSQVDQTSSFLGPQGIDYGMLLIQGLPVFIADRANERIVVAVFDRNASALNPIDYGASGDADLSGVTDVAFDGRGPGWSGIQWYVYALSVTGRVSYWFLWEGNHAGDKLWSYGGAGSGTGQFNAPKGICVGHVLGPDGGSVYTYDFYVADGGNHRLVWLQRTDSGPTWKGSVTLPNGGTPLSCAVDHYGNVIVADSLNSKLVKYTWNLTYLDSYGTYGTGATNNNTFAHPHAVDVPFGPKADPTFGWIWFGDGRVITAEDWGAQSGAREHFLGIDGSITAQPSTNNPQFSYFITDHGSQQVQVLTYAGTPVRTILNDALDPPGARTITWDRYTDQGTLAPEGDYKFQVLATSGYGCSGQSWCTKTLTTLSFLLQSDPGAPIVSISGPDGLTEGDLGTWTAVVSGGSAPLTYTWMVDGSPAGGDVSVTAGPWAGGAYHYIDLTVTDSQGRTGSSEKAVYVSCPQQCQ